MLHHRRSHCLLKLSHFITNFTEKIFEHLTVFVFLTNELKLFVHHQVTERLQMFPEIKFVIQSPCSGLVWINTWKCIWCLKSIVFYLLILQLKVMVCRTSYLFMTNTSWRMMNCQLSAFVLQPFFICLFTFKTSSVSSRHFSIFNSCIMKKYCNKTLLHYILLFIQCASLKRNKWRQSSHPGNLCTQTTNIHISSKTCFFPYIFWN